MTLLEKARSFHAPRGKQAAPDAEKLEVAIALIRGEITASQAHAALCPTRRSNGTNSVVCAFAILRAAVAAGQVEITEIPDGKQACLECGGVGLRHIGAGTYELCPQCGGSREIAIKEAQHGK